MNEKWFAGLVLLAIVGIAFAFRGWLAWISERMNKRERERRQP
jgi:hypothetical protein